MIDHRFVITVTTTLGAGKPKRVTFVADGDTFEEAADLLEKALHYGCVIAPDGTKITAKITRHEIIMAEHRRVLGTVNPDRPQVDLEEIAGIALTTLVKRGRSKDQSDANILP